MATNIVKDYSWTSIPKGSSLRDEAPFAIVRAYELDSSQLRQLVQGYTNIKDSIGGSGSSFYKNLYKGEKKKTYHFPFFSDSVRSFSNEFADTLSKVSDRGTTTIGNKLLEKGNAAALEIGAGGAALYREFANFGGSDGGGAGSYIETPKFYQYGAGSDQPLQISFTLSNTIEEGDAQKNQDFIEDFTKINRPTRKGVIAMTFPYIYNIKVPGQRYIEWAYVSSFNITLGGTRRVIGGKIVPEAYVCDFTFQSLTLEPANFMDEI